MEINGLEASNSNASSAAELLPAPTFHTRLSLTVNKLEEIPLLPCNIELHHTQLFENT